MCYISEKSKKRFFNDFYSYFSPFLSDEPMDYGVGRLDRILNEKAYSEDFTTLVFTIKHLTVYFYFKENKYDIEEMLYSGACMIHSYNYRKNRI